MLRALSVVGRYTQGHGFVVANLLLSGIAEDDVFWIMIAIVTELFPGFFNDTVSGIHEETAVLQHLLKQSMPKLDAHFKAVGLPLIAITGKIMPSLLVGHLPREAVMPVLEVLLDQCQECPTRARNTLLKVVLSVLKNVEDCALEATDVESVTNLICDFTELCKNAPLSLPFLDEAQNAFTWPFGDAHIDALRVGIVATHSENLQKHFGMEEFSSPDEKQEEANPHTVLQDIKNKFVRPKVKQDKGKKEKKDKTLAHNSQKATSTTPRTEFLEKQRKYQVDYTPSLGDVEKTIQQKIKKKKTNKNKKARRGIGKK